MSEQTTKTPLELATERLASLQAEAAEYLRQEEELALTLAVLNGIDDGEDKQILEERRPHILAHLASTKRERLGVQLRISAVERQIQALK